MNLSVRYLLAVTCATCFITATPVSADAKSLGQGRNLTQPKVAQPVSPPTVREHTGAPPPGGVPSIRCRADGTCREYQGGRPHRVYPKVRDHRTEAPRTGSKNSG